jgi:hypothetical protein
LFALSHVRKKCVEEIVQEIVVAEETKINRRFDKRFQLQKTKTNERFSNLIK